MPRLSLAAFAASLQAGGRGNPGHARLRCQGACFLFRSHDGAKGIYLGSWLRLKTDFCSALENANRAMKEMISPFFPPLKNNSIFLCFLSMKI